MLDEKIMTLLGLAVYQAQKMEFALYGILEQFKHLPEIKDDRRFRDIINLPQGDFLSSDPATQELYRNTLGQITSVFGISLPLPKDDLKQYVLRRNLIVHNFYRHFCTQFGSGDIANPESFLLDFIKESDAWIKAIRGMISLMLEADAKKHGRGNEFSTTPEDMDNRNEYYSLMARSGTTP